MRVIKNEKLIKRNKQIGQWTSLAALVILIAGAVISLQRPEWFNYSLLALLIGFTLTQVGMYYGNRFSRSPRPDEQLDAGLKGLPGDYTIYHYVSPAAHLLIGPAGVWVLLPYHQRGQVTYKNNRWRMSGGGFMQAYMRIFGQESIGRPDLEAASEINAVKKVLAARLPQEEIPAIHTALVFTNEEVQIEAKGAPMPALPLKQLKDFLRKKARENPLPATTIKQLTDVFR
jgi:hypothetical protein